MPNGPERPWQWSPKGQYQMGQRGLGSRPTFWRMGLRNYQIKNVSVVHIQATAHGSRTTNWAYSGLRASSTCQKLVKRKILTRYWSRRWWSARPARQHGLARLACFIFYMCWTMPRELLLLMRAMAHVPQPEKVKFWHNTITCIEYLGQERVCLENMDNMWGFLTNERWIKMIKL